MASIKKIRNHRLLAIFSPLFWMNLLDERALFDHCAVNKALTQRYLPLPFGQF